MYDHFWYMWLLAQLFSSATIHGLFCGNSFELAGLTLRNDKFV